MTSLRMRLALPVAATAVAAALIVDLLVLRTLQNQLADDLQLRLERYASLLSSVQLSAGEKVELRGVAIVAIRPDGTTRLPFPPWLPSDWAVLDPDAPLPAPQHFLDVPAVGMLLETPPATWSGLLLPDERPAILLATGSAVAHYQDLRVRLILLSSTGVLLVILVAQWVAVDLGRHLRRMTRKIAVLADGDAAAMSRAKQVDELTALSNELEQANASLVQTKSNIERLQRMRSEFLANVSHEVRTPLFALRGYLETLLDGGLSDPSVNRAFVEKAHAHAQRLDLLLKDLIEISRIESGDMKLSFRYFRLQDLLQPAVEAHRDAAQAKGQSLKLRSIDGEVLGDRERLMQAISNLLENAIAYCPAGAHIALNAVDAGSHVRIEVADDGPGIPPEHQERVFERFYRVDANRSREVGGTGLGLAIVKHIVEAHGAKVRLVSSLGSGSIFSFELHKST